MGEKANDRNTCHTMSIIITSKEQNTHDDTLLLTLLEAFQQQKKSISSLYSTSLPQKGKWDLFSLLKEASLLFRVVRNCLLLEFWTFFHQAQMVRIMPKILYFSSFRKICLPGARKNLTFRWSEWSAVLLQNHSMNNTWLKL